MDSVCYEQGEITTAGAWFFARPLSASLPLAMAQIAIIIVASHAVDGLVGRHLALPSIASQILAGIILGPSCMGRIRGFAEVLFPRYSWMQLNISGYLGLMFLMFITGVQTDVGIVRSSGRTAVVIGVVSQLTPPTLLMFTNIFRPDLIPTTLATKIAVDWAPTSFVVVSCLLNELKLLNSKMGRLAMSVSLVAEFTHIGLNNVFASVSQSRNVRGQAMSFTLFVALIAFIVFVARPYSIWIVRQTPEGKELDIAYFASIALINFICGLVSEVTGHHADLGMFLLGLALPSGPPLGSTIANKLSLIVSGFGLPVFVATTVYGADFSVLSDVRSEQRLGIFLLITVLGKFLGIVFVSLYCKLSLRNSIIMALIMSAKGIYEVKILLQWQARGIIDQRSRSLITCFVFVLAVVTAPLVKTLIESSSKYTTNKKRSVQSTKYNADLGLLTCIHNQENAASVICIVDALNSRREGKGSISIYILHLVEMVARVAAVLTHHRKQHGNSSTYFSDTDHIVNAFRRLEQGERSCLSVEPFVSISPYATMHDDICSVALETKAAMVILPFHKKMAMDGCGLESVNQAFQTVNTKVLDLAPCSVGILVDHDLAHSTSILRSNNLLHRIAVYFLGGPDDREALSFAMRMADNVSINLTVIRFLPPAEQRLEADEEEILDDEVLCDLKITTNTTQQRVSYREEVVKDGEAMVTVIRNICDCFNLLIVGRGKERENVLTSGLSGWSEFPELGIVGDMLASPDFGSKTSTLVVQQQRYHRVAQKPRFSEHHGTTEIKPCLVNQFDWRLVL